MSAQFKVGDIAIYFKKKETADLMEVDSRLSYTQNVEYLIQQISLL